MSKDHPNEASDVEIATGMAHAPSAFLARVLARLQRAEQERDEAISVAKEMTAKAEWAEKEIQSLRTKLDPARRDTMCSKQ